VRADPRVGLEQRQGLEQGEAFGRGDPLGPPQGLVEGPSRRLDLAVSESELTTRRTQWKPRPAPPEQQRGYVSLYRERVLQADEGADFDFLCGRSGAVVRRESH